MISSSEFQPGIGLKKSLDDGGFTLPRSGFVQQVKARGHGKAVTFFQKVAIFTMPVFEALNIIHK